MGAPEFVPHLGRILSANFKPWKSISTTREYISSKGGENPIAILFFEGGGRPNTTGVALQTKWENSWIICWKGLKSSVSDFRPLVGAYPKVWPFQTLRVSSWGYICWACINVQFYVITRMTLATHFKLQYRSLLFCSLLLGDSCFLFHQFTSHHHWHLTIKATSSPNSMLLHWPVPNSLLRTCIK